MREYRVGQMVDMTGQKALVTRVVSSSAYFEDWDTGETYAIDELYVELLYANGDIGFMSLIEEKRPCPRAAGAFKGPDTLEWRKVMVGAVDGD